MAEPFKPALSGSPTGDPHPTHMVVLITNDPNASSIVERTNYHDCTVVAAIPFTSEEDYQPDEPLLEQCLGGIIDHNANNALVTHVHVCEMGPTTFDYPLLVESVTTPVVLNRVVVEDEEALRSYIEDALALTPQEGPADTNQPISLGGGSEVGARSSGLSDFLERVGNSIPAQNAEPTADWWERKFARMKVRLEAVRHRNMDLEGLITNATALNDRLLAIIEKLAEGPRLDPEDDLFIPKTDD